MNPKVKKLWIKALRSGKYKQGTNRLRTYDGYCCLGVLCDLYDKTLVRGRWRKPTAGPDTGTWLYNTNAGDLPSSVMRWAGLTDSDPMLDTDRNICASQANDSLNYRFSRIATLIEKNL